MKRNNKKDNENIFYKGFKTKCFPNQEQQTIIFKSIGTARYCYNWALAKQQENHNNGGKYISYYDMRKLLNQHKKDEGFEWLYDVAERTCRLALEDLNDAFQKFFSGKSDYPKFKTKKKSKKSFGLNYESLKFNEKQVKLEKIGWIDLAEKVPNNNVSYVNPKLSYDGVNFWFSVSIEHKAVDENIKFKECKSDEPKTEPIGIDLGLKTLFVCSNGMKVKKPNVKKYQKKLIRLQKQASKSYEKLNILYETLKKDNPKLRYEELKSNRVRKLERKINKLFKRISNILDNNIHQTTTKIIKLNPKAVIIEDLNVKGMLKNKHLSKTVQEAKFYEIRRQFEYKCKNNKVELIIADRFYPSSKKCSCCGEIKKDLKLKDRIYVCPKCDLVIDRDYNASLNLRSLAI